MKNYLTAKEISKVLKISMSKLYKMTSCREIPHKKIFGSLRFDQKEIEKFLEQNCVDIKMKDRIERETKILKSIQK